jgi:hypothetical protein
MQILFKTGMIDLINYSDQSANKFKFLKYNIIKLWLTNKKWPQLADLSDYLAQVHLKKLASMPICLTKY